MIGERRRTLRNAVPATIADLRAALGTNDAA